MDRRRKESSRHPPDWDLERHPHRPSRRFREHPSSTPPLLSSAFPSSPPSSPPSRSFAPFFSLHPSSPYLSPPSSPDIICMRKEEAREDEEDELDPEEFGEKPPPIRKPIPTIPSYFEQLTNPLKEDIQTLSTIINSYDVLKTKTISNIFEECRSFLEEKSSDNPEMVILLCEMLEVTLCNLQQDETIFLCLLLVNELEILATKLKCDRTSFHDMVVALMSQVNHLFECKEGEEEGDRKEMEEEKDDRKEMEEEKGDRKEVEEEKDDLKKVEEEKDDRKEVGEEKDDRKEVEEEKDEPKKDQGAHQGATRGLQVIMDLYKSSPTFVKEQIDPTLRKILFSENWESFHKPPEYADFIVQCSILLLLYCNPTTSALTKFLEPPLNPKPDWPHSQSEATLSSLYHIWGQQKERKGRGSPARHLQNWVDSFGHQNRDFPLSLVENYCTTFLPSWLGNRVPRPKLIHSVFMVELGKIVSHFLIAAPHSFDYFPSLTKAILDHGHLEKTAPFLVNLLRQIEEKVPKQQYYQPFFRPLMRGYFTYYGSEENPLSDKFSHFLGTFDQFRSCQRMILEEVTHYPLQSLVSPKYLREYDFDYSFVLSHLERLNKKPIKWTQEFGTDWLAIVEKYFCSLPKSFPPSKIERAHLTPVTTLMQRMASTCKFVKKRRDRVLIEDAKGFVSHVGFVFEFCLTNRPYNAVFSETMVPNLISVFNICLSSDPVVSVIESSLSTPNARRAFEKLFSELHPFEVDFVKQRPDTTTFPPIYDALSKSFAIQFNHHLENSGHHLSSELLTGISHLFDQPRKYCLFLLYIFMPLCVGMKEKLKRNRFDPPSEVSIFLQKVGPLILRSHFPGQYKDPLIKIHQEIENIVVKAIASVTEGELKKEEIDFLSSEKRLNRLIDTVGHIEKGVKGISRKTISAYDSRFLIGQREYDQLVAVDGYFISENIYLPGTQFIQHCLPASELTLVQLEKGVKKIRNAFGLAPQTLRALCIFVEGRSRIFLRRFENNFAESHGDSIEVGLRIERACDKAIADLQHLILNEDATLSSFIEQIGDLVSEFSGQSQKQLQCELDLTRDYFSSLEAEEGRTGSLSSSHENIGIKSLDEIKDRLISALQVVQYSNVFPSFLRTVKDLQFLPPERIHEMEFSETLDELDIQKDFLLSSAPQKRIKLAHFFGSMYPICLEVIAEIQGKLIDFLQKKSEGFDQMMTLAMSNYSGNDHVLLVLNSLQATKKFLEPFVARSFLSLSDMAKSVNKLCEGASSLSDVPIYKYMAAVTQQLELIECYYLNFDESGISSEQILNFVRSHFNSGHFMSCVDGSESSGLSFEYTVPQAGGSHLIVSLSPNELKEQVQSAVLRQDLGSASETSELSDFIKSYEFALKAHKLREGLRAEGHPTTKPERNELLGSVKWKDLSQLCSHFDRQIIDWRRQLQSVVTSAPALRLLSGRGLLRFLHTFQERKKESSVPLTAAALLPYVIECLGSQHLMEQQKIYLAILRYLQETPSPQTVTPEKSLQALGQMVTNIQMDVVGFIDPMDVSDETFPATYWDLRNAESVYDAVMSNFIAETGMVPLPSQILWCSNSTSKHQVREWIERASLPLPLGLFCAVGVNLLCGPAREELLQGILEGKFYSNVNLVFNSSEGLESFLFLESLDVEGSTDRSDLRKQFWGFQKFNDIQPISRVVVVTGESGQGKTRWIQTEIEKSSPHAAISFVVHEGFSCQLALSKYKEVVRQWEANLQRKEGEEEKTQGLVMSIHVDVTPFADVEKLGLFLHQLITVGLLIDDESGGAVCLDPKFTHQIYVELPQLEKDDEKFEMWPTSENPVTKPETHPFLRSLPVLMAAHSQKDGIVAVTPQFFPFIVGNNERKLAYLLQFLEKEDFLKLASENPPIHKLTEDEVRVELKRVWEAGQVPENRLLQLRFINLMIQRTSFYETLQREYKKLIDSNEVAPVRVWIDKPSKLSRLGYRGSGLAKYVPRFCQKLFQLLLMEVSHLICRSESLMIERIWTLLPQNPNELCVVISGNREDIEDRKIQLEKAYLPNIKILSSKKLRDWEKILASVAPAFGLRDTGDFRRKLNELGFVLTPECLMKLLFLHNSRQSRASLIFEGDSGMGKSELLKLYSHIINLDNNLFANLKSHLRSLVLGLGEALSLKPLLQLRNDPGRLEDGEELIESILTSAVASPSSFTQIGDAVCGRFCELFHAYPLQLSHANQQVKDAIQRFENLKTTSQQRVQLASTLARSADAFETIPKVPSTSSQSSSSPLSSTNAKPMTARQKGDSKSIFSTEAEFRVFLQSILKIEPVGLFHRILAHEGLTPAEWREYVSFQQKEAVLISKICPQATICVFIDELNTANALGMIQEVLTRHTLDGVELSPNLFFVGAINPLIESRCVNIDFTRLSMKKIGKQKEREKANDGCFEKPFVVRALPSSLKNMVTLFEPLSQAEERCFLELYVDHHLASLKKSIGPRNSYDWRPFFSRMVHSILNSQRIVRSFLKYPILSRVRVSIRDLVRAVRLFCFLAQFSVPNASGEAINVFLPAGDSLQKVSERCDNALVMAILLTYYYRLPSQDLIETVGSDLRAKFLESLGSSQHLDAASLQRIEKLSLANLWSYIKVPPGLAHTPALKENLYCIMVAVNFGFPLLITGPPGCGKTLSFSLAENNLKGMVSDSCSFVAAKLKHLHVHPYQCSQYSSAKEIEAVYRGALSRQTVLDSLETGKNVCCVFLDEAGLPAERKQALKATHDVLDQHGGISTVMLSNSTLDAAKTNRMLQVVQTQTSFEDLKLLGIGVLTGEGGSESFTTNFRPSSARLEGLEKKVEWLCESYERVTKAKILPSSTIRWFHNRDFVYLCRHLKRSMEHSSTRTLNTEMVLEALRRNFQTVNPLHFDLIAQDFLKEFSPTTPTPKRYPPEPLLSLKKSIHDLHHGDPNSAPFRHTMILDSTESQAAIDLLYDRRIRGDLDLCPVVISDFVDDSSMTRKVEALRVVKDAVERGRMLVLVNSDSLHSALYDLFNRYYTSVPDSSGSTQYFANIAIGKVSRHICVHPEFRVVLHLPYSRLASTPTPFLNRFSKFHLRVSNVLWERVSEFAQNPPALLLSCSPEHLSQFFKALYEGVEDFAKILGGSSTLYGYIQNETVPALILQILDEIEKAKDPSLIPDLALNHPSGFSEPSSLPNISTNSSQLAELAPDRRFLSRLRDFIRLVNFRLMQIARPEMLFAIRAQLPAHYLVEYVENQEHFSISQLICNEMSALSERTSCVRKVTIFTRTFAELVSKKRLGGYKLSILNSDSQKSAPGELNLLSLASFSSGESVIVALESFFSFRSQNPKALIIYVNAAVSTASQVNFVRHETDRLAAKLNASGSPKHLLVALVLSIPPEQVSFRPFYHSVALNSWDYVYVDSFGDEEEEKELSNPKKKQVRLSDARSWLRVAWGLTEIPSLEHMKSDSFRSEISSYLSAAIQSLKFWRPPLIIPDLKKRGCLKCLAAYDRNREKARLWVQKQTLSRPFILEAFLDSIAELWSVVLSRTVEGACGRIVRGETVRSILASVKNSQHWLLVDYFASILRSHLYAEFGLEAIMDLPEEPLKLPQGWNQFPEKTPPPLPSLDDILSYQQDRFGHMSCHLRGGLLVQILEALPSPLPEDILSLSLSLLDVPCSARIVARTPLYGSFMKTLDQFFTELLHRWDLNAPLQAHRILFTKQKDDTKNQKKLMALAHCIAAIDQHPFLVLDWLCDFFKITLALPIKDLFQSNLLITLAIELAEADKSFGGIVIKTRIGHQARLVSYANNILSVVDPLLEILDESAKLELLRKSKLDFQFEELVLLEGIRCVWAMFESLVQLSEEKKSKQIAIEPWVKAMCGLCGSGAFRSSAAVMKLPPENVKKVWLLVTSYYLIGHAPKKTSFCLKKLVPILKAHASKDSQVDISALWEVLFGVLEVGSQALCKQPNLLAELTSDALKWALSPPLLDSLPESIQSLLILALSGLAPQNFRSISQQQWTLVNSLPPYLRRMWLIKFKMIDSQNGNPILNKQLRTAFPRLAEGYQAPMIPNFVSGCLCESINTSLHQPSFSLPDSISPVIHFLIEVVLDILQSEKDPVVIANTRRSLINSRTTPVVNCFLEISVVSHSVRLVELVTELLGQDPLADFDFPVLSELQDLMTEQPMEWGPYLLTRVPNLEALKIFIARQDLLQTLNLGDWYAQESFVRGDEFSDQPTYFDSEQPYLPMMVCESDPHYAVYKSTCRMLDGGMVTQQDLHAWTTANDNWVARGTLILALYYECWSKKKACPAVLEWSEKIANKKSKLVPKAATLSLNEKEALCYRFLAEGPQPPQHRQPGKKTEDFSWIFSSASFQDVSDADLRQNSLFRAASVSVLAMILGSPREKLYYRTPLFDVKTIANGRTVGLGSGYLTLAKDCGYKFADTAKNMFDDTNPALVPFNNEKVLRLLNNSWIYMAHAWNTILFLNVGILKTQVFTFWYSDLPFNPHENEELACIIYASNRATSFYNTFVSSYETKYKPHGNSIYGWGAAIQETWMATLDPAATPHFQSTYPSSQLKKVEKTMDTLRGLWEGAFETQEKKMRDAILDLMGRELKLRLVALEDCSLRSQKCRSHPPLSDDRFWDYLASSSGNSNLSPFDRTCAKFLHYLLCEAHESLRHLVYLPEILSLYTFVHTELAYKMTWSEANTTPLEEAIEKYLPNTAAQGKCYVARFRTAWAALRSHFQTFDQCGRELAQVAEIPALLGKDLTVGAVATDPKLLMTEEDGCPLIRLIKTRLIDAQNKALSALDSSFQTNESFNRYEWVIENQGHNSCSLHNLPNTAAIWQKLLAFHEVDGKEGVLAEPELTELGLGYYDPKLRTFSFRPILRYVCQKYLAGRPQISASEISLRFKEKEEYQGKERGNQRSERNQNASIKTETNYRLEFLKEKLKASLCQMGGCLELTPLEKKRTEMKAAQNDEQTELLLQDLVDLSQAVLLSLESSGTEESSGVLVILSDEEEKTAGKNLRLQSLFNSFQVRSAQLDKICGGFTIAHLPSIITVTHNATSDRAFGHHKILNVQFTQVDLRSFIKKMKPQEEDQVEVFIQKLRDFATELNDVLPHLNTISPTTILSRIPKLQQLKERDPDVAGKVLDLPVCAQNFGPILRILRETIGHLGVDLMRKRAQKSLATQGEKEAKGEENERRVYQEKVVSFDELQLAKLIPDAPASFLDIESQTLLSSIEGDDSPLSFDYSPLFVPSPPSSPFSPPSSPSFFSLSSSPPPSLSLSPSPSLSRSPSLSFSPSTALLSSPPSDRSRAAGLLLRGVLTENTIVSRKKQPLQPPSSSHLPSYGSSFLSIKHPDIEKSKISVEDVKYLSLRGVLKIQETDEGLHISQESWQKLRQHCILFSEYVRQRLKKGASKSQTPQEEPDINRKRKRVAQGDPTKRQKMDPDVCGEGALDKGSLISSHSDVSISFEETQKADSLKRKERSESEKNLVNGVGSTKRPRMDTSSSPEEEFDEQTMVKMERQLVHELESQNIRLLHIQFQTDLSPQTYLLKKDSEKKISAVDTLLRVDQLGGLTEDDVRYLGEKKHLVLKFPFKKMRVTSSTWKALPSALIRVKDFAVRRLKEMGEPTDSFTTDRMIGVIQKDIEAKKDKRLFQIQFEGDHQTEGFLLEEEVSKYKPALPKEKLFDPGELGLCEEDAKYLSERGILILKSPFKRTRVTESSWQSLLSLCVPLEKAVAKCIEVNKGKINEDPASLTRAKVTLLHFLGIHKRPFVMKTPSDPEEKEYVLDLDVSDYLKRISSRLLDSNKPPLSTSGLKKEDILYLISKGALVGRGESEKAMGKREEGEGTWDREVKVTELSWINLMSKLISIDQFFEERGVQAGALDIDDFVGKLRIKKRAFELKIEEKNKEMGKESGAVVSYFLKEDLADVLVGESNGCSLEDFQKNHLFSDEEIRYLEAHVFHTKGEEEETFQEKFRRGMIEVSTISAILSMEVEDLLVEFQQFPFIRVFSLDDSYRSCENGTLFVSVECAKQIPDMNDYL